MIYTDIYTNKAVYEAKNALEIEMFFSTRYNAAKLDDFLSLYIQELNTINHTVNYCFL